MVQIPTPKPYIFLFLMIWGSQMNFWFYDYPQGYFIWHGDISSILNCCVKHITVSNKLMCQTYYNVLLSTCRRHTSTGEDSKLSVCMPQILMVVSLNKLNFQQNHKTGTKNFKCLCCFFVNEQGVRGKS